MIERKKKEKRVFKEWEKSENNKLSFLTPCSEFR